MATVTNLGFSIFSRYDGTGTRRAKNDINDLQRSVNKAAAGFGSWINPINSVAAAAVALGPALIPIAGAALTAGAGLTSMAVAAGSALGVYGVATVGAVKQTLAMGQSSDKLHAALTKQQQKLASMSSTSTAYTNQQKKVNQAQQQYTAALAKSTGGNAKATAASNKLHAALTKQEQKLGTMSSTSKAYAAQQQKVNQAQDAYNKELAKFTVPQRNFIAAVDDMKSTWSGFIEATSGSTLGPLTKGIGGVSAAIGRMAPVVKAVAPVADQAAAAFKRWATGSGIDRFIAVLTNYGIPILKTLVHDSDLVGASLGRAFRASLPLALSVTGVLSNGASALDKWSSGGGFTRFFDRMQQQAPGVSAFLRAVWDAVKRLGQAATAAAPGALSLATSLARMIAAVPPQTLQAIGTGFVLWKSPLLWLVQSVPGLANAFVRLFGALTPSEIYAIAGALVAFRLAMFLMRFEIIATQVQLGILWLRMYALGPAIDFAMGPIGLIILASAALVAAIVFIALKTTWFQTAWRATWGAVLFAVIPVWHQLDTGIHGVVNTMISAWRQLAATGKQIWGEITAGWNNSVQFVKRVTESGVNGMKTAWRSLEGAFSATWHFVDRNIFQPLKSGIGAVRSGFDSAMNGIKGAWGRLKDAAAGPVRFFVNTVYDSGLKVAWNNTVGKIIPGSKLPGWRVNFATGGKIRGPGGPTDDRVPIMASADEYIIRAKAAKRIGYRTLDMLNRGTARFATGGQVGGGLPGAGTINGRNPNPVLHGNGKPYNPGLFGSLTNLPGVGAAVHWAIDMGRDAAASALRALLAPIRGSIHGMVSRFSGNTLAQYISTLSDTTFDKMIDWVKGKVREPSAGKWSGALGPAGPGTPAGVAQQYAASQLGKFGWGQDQMLSLIGLWNGECMPLDTRILTRRGWLKHSEVEVGDFTIGYNEKSGGSEWTRVTRIVRYDNAPTVRFGNAYWSVVCTPGHRWLMEDVRVRTSYGPRPEREILDQFEYVKSEGLVRLQDRQKNHRVILARRAETDGSLDITLEEAGLLGWIAGDGYVSWGPRNSLHVGVAQAKTEHFADIERCFSAHPERSRYATRSDGRHRPVTNWRLRAAYARDLMARIGHHPKTDAVALVLAMSQEQRDAWLSAVIRAEGSVGGHKTVIYQNAGEIAEAIKLAVYLGGNRPSVSEYHREGSVDSVEASIRVTAPTIGGPKRHSFIEAAETQPVWCVTTELGSWTAEQEGHIFLTGNSGWNSNAVNVGSGAYGIPQALGHGHPFALGDYKGQIDWGLNYIKGRYGSPRAAYGAWLSRSPHWYASGGRVMPYGSYDTGGYLPKGLSLAYNGTGKPERVGGGGGPAVEFNDCVFVGGNQRDFEDILVAAYTEAKRKGRIK